MNDRARTAPGITGGVDTHKDTHTAAALDATGKAIGNATFPASAAGYAEMLEWFRSFGESIELALRARDLTALDSPSTCAGKGCMSSR